MSRKNNRSGFAVLEIVIAAVVIGLLISLSIGPVRSAFRLKKENAMQQNIQAVWIGANEYFLKNEVTEVQIADLLKPDSGVKAVSQIKPVVGEDYTKINGGKITATDTALELTYDEDGTQRTVKYSVR